MPAIRPKIRSAQTDSPSKPDSLLPGPPEGYEACKGEIAIRMGHFFIRHLSRLYHDFDGDLALIIVLGEIGHHNASHFYSSQGPLPNPAFSDGPTPAVWERLTPCNAFSLSAATGIPRETVRRKIAWLVKRGWIKQSTKGEVWILPAVSQHFTTDFNVHTLRELLELSNQLRALLAAKSSTKRTTKTSTQQGSHAQ